MTMMPTTAGSQPLVSDDLGSGRISRRTAWLTVLMLFLFMLINYADRSVVGLAAKPIMEELGLTPSQFGLIGSSFFFLYAVSSIATGFLASRIESRIVLFGLVAFWSLCQFPMMFASGFASLLACRIALGAGEGPSFPMAVHTVFKWFPDERRALPVAFISQGSALGVVVAAPLLTFIITHYNWHVAFGFLGICGLVWAACWALVGREGPLQTTVTVTGAVVERTPWRNLLLNRTVIGVWLGLFGAYWILGLVLAWFTPYLANVMGFSQMAAGTWTMVPWAGGAVMVLAVGWISQTLLLRGWSSRSARAVLASVAGLAGGLCLMSLPFLEAGAIKLALLFVGVILPNAIIVPSQPILAEVSPVPQRAPLLAIGNAVSSIAGLLSPFIAGKIIESWQSAPAGYDIGFAVGGGVAVVVGLLGLVMIHPRETAGSLAKAGGAAA